MNHLAFDPMLYKIVSACNKLFKLWSANPAGLDAHTIFDDLNRLWRIYIYNFVF